MGGMTDALLGLVGRSPSRLARHRSRPGDAVAALYRGRQACCRESAADAVLATFARDLQDIRDVLHAVSLVRSAADRSRDLIAGFGELWSSRLLAAYLRKRAVAATDPVRWIDARQLIVVEQGEIGPVVQWEVPARATRRLGAMTATGIAVVTGFIASDAGGLHTTLGRNGSDFSASIVGALLDGLATSSSGPTWTGS